MSIAQSSARRREPTVGAERHDREQSTAPRCRIVGRDKGVPSTAEGVGVVAVGVNVAGELRPGDDQWRGAVDAVHSRSPNRVHPVLGGLRRLVLAAGAVFVIGSCLAAWALTNDATWVVGSTSDNPPAIGDNDNLAGLSAVVSFAGDQAEGLPVEERSIALTFDDGPDPVFTSQILDVLERHGVQATFFVLGANAVDHPGLLRQTVAAGHELGIHTWNHPRLATPFTKSCRRPDRLTLDDRGGRHRCVHHLGPAPLHRGCSLPGPRRDGSGLSGRKRWVHRCHGRCCPTRLPAGDHSRRDRGGCTATAR